MGGVEGRGGETENGGNVMGEGRRWWEWEGVRREKRTKEEEKAKYICTGATIYKRMGKKER